MADHLLTTCRSVRRHLDLDKSVPAEIVEACIRIAQQAPLASNREIRRWVVIRDYEQKAALAAVYRRTNEFRRKAERASDADTRRVYESAGYLANILEQVPVLVIPCLLGRPETKTAAELSAFYGTAYPAIWSFQLALWARGLGSTITTAHLAHEDEVGRLLKLPAKVTQIAMIPVAFSKRQQLRAARRVDAALVTHADYWHTLEGLTDEHES